MRTAEWMWKVEVAGLEMDSVAKGLRKLWSRSAMSYDKMRR